MVAMFEAQVASGLKGFLGCSSAIFETALVEFFHVELSVQGDGMVVSTVLGKQVAFSEELFASTFALPLEGLTDLHEVPKDFVLEARRAFSHDVKVNWGRLLFNIFKDIVKPGSRQARGYAVQICILLKNVPNLELGDSKELPPLKVLTAKIVSRYIAINKNIVVEDVDDDFRVKKTPVKKQDQAFRVLIKSVRQEAQNQADVFSIKLEAAHAQNACLLTDLADTRKEVKEQKAEIFKEMDERLATIRNDLLDFRAQAQENHLNLSTQLGFLIDYINRGGDAKKGESGSSRPQPPPDDQSRPSGGSGSSSRRRDDRSGSKRHPSSGGGGPYKRDAEYWTFGKNQF
ncbi:hypothetical protein F511_36824 [Dorcoceras hygrometricum]|uniref:Uncharacterized protein n=1 Tax=Dorcoceras hygrometricum TaxID=472368 RepID=A0A2Z7BY44_9LAMI|nr:hypothetical protein F511_36824 [Dorcoceras hygrometricum]